MEKFYERPTEKEMEIAKETCRLINNHDNVYDLEPKGIFWVDAGCEKSVYRNEELPGWVIKKGNESCYYEAKNYERAEAEGLTYYFAPSYFIMKLEEEVGSKEHSVLVDRYYTMQREVICDRDTNWDSLNEYIKRNYYTDEDYEKVENGERSEYDLFERYEEEFTDMDNVDALIGFTSSMEQEVFEDFCDKFDLNDLHYGNFGFSPDLNRTVIIDYSGYHCWETFGEIA